MIIIPNEKIIEVMQEVIDNYLKPKFIELGMNASGEWLNSLEPRAYNGNGEIWGRDYTYYLVNGRAGGSMPPITPLVNWVGNKLGIYGKEGLSVAFAVAKKIEREGTDYYPNGTDLLEVLESPEVTQFVYNRFEIEISGMIRSQIVRSLQNTFSQ